MLDRLINLLAYVILALIISGILSIFTIAIWVMTMFVSHLIF